MIVECASCRTRYRVDESRIPGRGARMRCRRCGKAIIVMKEGGAKPAPPAPRQNLFDLRTVLRRSEQHPAGLPEAPLPGETDAVFPPAGGIPGGDLRAAEAGPADLRVDAGAHAPPAAPDASLPGAAPPSEVGGPYLRQPGPAPEEPRAAAQVDAPPAAPDASLPDAAPPSEAGGPPLRQPESPSGAPSFLPEETGEVQRREERASAREEPEVSPIFSLGLEPPAEKDRPFELVLEDAGLLDFMKEGTKPGAFDISRSLRPHPSPEAGAQPPPPVDETPVKDAKAERLEAIQRELEEIGGGAPAAAEASPAPPQEPAAARAAPSRPFPPVAPANPVRAVRPAVFALLVLFLLVAGGGAYLGFTRSGKEVLRSLIPGMESLWLGGENAAPRYAVGNLIGYYEANARAGPMFVIKGLVTNQGRNKRSGVRMHAGILGRDGKTVAESTAYAGNVLSGEALRTSSRQAIEEEMGNRWGSALMNLDIPPGKSVPFMVVFFDAPEGVEEYRLDARDVE